MPPDISRWATFLRRQETLEVAVARERRSRSCRRQVKVSTASAEKGAGMI